MQEFVRATAIRAAHTAAQTFIATVGTTSLLSEVDWKITASTVAMAVIISVAKSILIGLPEVKEE